MCLPNSAVQALGKLTGLTQDVRTRLFQVGGASIAGKSHAFDRHWRNARTIATHNPLAYKRRALGANLLNDDPL